MIKKKTVLVLGAGASSPYGFPTGAELRVRIINAGAEMLRGLKKQYHDSDEYYEYGKKFVTKFKFSGVNSIDRFLFEQSDNDKILGKILIMAFIKEYEKHSKFVEDIDMPYHDWYRIFYNRLISGVKKFDDLTFDNIKIITFNYDRSLEFFLYMALRNTYWDVKNEDIITKLNTIEVNHVFGKIENMAWENGSFDMESIESLYRKSFHDFNYIRSYSDNIKIIDEVEVDKNYYKNLIETAEQVFFLGFGYLDENMTVLGAPFKKQSGYYPRFYATAYKNSQEMIGRIHRKYFSAVNVNKNPLLDCDCCSLISDYLY